MEEDIRNETVFDQLLKEAVKDTDSLPPPKDILLDGRFVLRSRLGSGGMGVVYEAFDNKLSAKVALKMLSDITPTSIYHLKQEFRSLADVSHPNLVLLHELFTENARWFFTMELVVGKSLIEHLNIDFDIARLRRVFLSLAEGIHAIHDAGKLHRDLKPNNVLVTPAGEVKVLDFGLVSDQQPGGVGQTIPADGVSGTPTYMAPEQAAAQPALPASDWYAFGVMLFEALTGRPPFEADTSHGLLERKQVEEAPRASLLGPHIPDDLDRLCRGLLALNPADRPEYEYISSLLGAATQHSLPRMLKGDSSFVGREGELRRLEEAFRDTEEERPVVVFVQGPSGIGKSTLVDRFLKRVGKHHNAVILRGRCYERESVPFKACDPLFDDLTRYLRCVPENYAARFMPLNVPALAKIFPVLNRLDVVRKTKQRHLLPSDPNKVRQIAFLAAKELLMRLSSQEPLILYVDDLQWSDVDGVKLLTSLVSPPNAPSMLLIGAYRSEDDVSSPGLTVLHDRIRKIEGLDVRSIDVQQLTMDESHALAGVLLPEDSKGLAAAIAKEACGSPFFICELARFASRAPLDDRLVRLEHVIECRIQGLSRRARELVELIAVSGRPLDERLLQAVTNRSNLSGPLRTAEAFRLIRQTGGTRNIVACYHDRIREAVLAGLDPDQTRQCHRRLADALESEKSPDPIVLTEHYLGAEDDAGAGTYAAKAARLAADALAFENAIRFYRLALKLNPGDRNNERALESALGDALANAGHGAEAALLFMRAAADAHSEDALELHRRAAQQLINTGHMEAGMREMNGVLGAVGMKLHTRFIGTLLALVRNRIALKRVLPRIGKSPTKLVSRRKLLEIRACEGAWMGLWAADTFQAAALCARHLRASIQAGIVPDIIRGLSAEAAFRATEGARGYALSLRLTKQAEALSAEANDSEIAAFLQFARGMAKFSRGHLLEAIPLLESAETLRHAKCTRSTPALEIAQAFLGESYTRLGAWRTLCRAWDHWVTSATETGNLHQLAVCRMWTMGTIRFLIMDQPEAASDSLQQGIAGWPWPRFDLLRFLAYISRSYIHLYNGEAAPAFDTHRELMSRLQRSPVSRIQIARVLFAVDYARSALALAAAAKVKRRPLSVARKLVRKLKKEDISYGVTFIPYILGTIAHLEGKDDLAVPLLKEAIEGFDKESFALHSAATKHRLAALTGGDEGRTLRAQAEETMQREDILNTDRMIALIAPGFTEDRF